MKGVWRWKGVGQLGKSRWEGERGAGGRKGDLGRGDG